ncbi:MAG: C-factor [Devosia sp.]|nr:C-factor [Devosia sp.]
MTIEVSSNPPTGLAVIIGVQGGIGSALQDVITNSRRYEKVLGFSRAEDGFDLTSEASIRTAATAVAALGLPLRLVIVATGLLHDASMQPEKTWRQLDADQLLRSFAVNAVGPALVAKHFLPLFPRGDKAVFAALSAKVGSIGDNHLGGWYGYRAAKAALNQLMRTASIELRRTHPLAICVTLHPGTVATALSAPFHSLGHDTVKPSFAAERLISVIDGLRSIDSGLMLDHSGLPLPW